MPPDSQMARVAGKSLASQGLSLPARRVESDEVPQHPKGTISGWGQPMNLSTVTDTFGKIQAALRQAERGKTWQLFTLYRDIVAGNSHINAEFFKRKMVITGQPYSLQAIDKKNSDDVKACEAIKAMIESCDNWDSGILHLLDASLYPASGCEKIYEDGSLTGFPLRYRLKQLYPIDYALFSYEIAYWTQSGTEGPQHWNPEDWEPNLRFYGTLPNGSVNYSPSAWYMPDKDRHLIHRGHAMVSIPDNFGGPMRSIIFWWFLQNSGRDWWARFAERFGSPFMSVSADTNNKDTVTYLQAALSMATKLFGIVIPKGAELQLQSADQAGGAQGYKLFFDTCNEEISKIILGQTMSASAKGGGGLGQGTASLHAEVRDDVRQFDQKTLCNTLKAQLFKPFLQINGLPERAPNIIWGGLDEVDALNTSSTLSNLYAAGLRPQQEGLEVLSERLGIPLEFIPEEQKSNAQNNGNNQPSKPSGAVG